jgi:hypothetical protein
MADDALARVLTLVAEGRLTAEEAAPILDALEPGGGRRSAGAAPDAAADGGAAPSPPLPPPPPRPAQPGEPRFARVEVRDGGRTTVNLRVPLSLGRRALGLVPGLSLSQVADINDAVSRGLSGPIVDIEDDDGDGVRIVLE